MQTAVSKGGEKHVHTFLWCFYKLVILVLVKMVCGFLLCLIWFLASVCILLNKILYAWNSLYLAHHLAPELTLDAKIISYLWQIWVKTPEVLARDRLLGSFSVSCSYW